MASATSRAVRSNAEKSGRSGFGLPWAPLERLCPSYDRAVKVTSTSTVASLPDEELCDDNPLQT